MDHDRVYFHFKGERDLIINCKFAMEVLGVLLGGGGEGPYTCSVVIGCELTIRHNVGSGCVVRECSVSLWLVT